MRPPASVWQGCGGYWQPLFIQEHLLPLGHAAWQGYLIQGRGFVVCSLLEGTLPCLDWSQTVVRYTIRYLPQADLAGYCQTKALELKEIDFLVAVVATYCPEQAMLLALEHGGTVSMALLQNLAIAPPDCHEQVCRRWDEFA